MDPIKIVPYNPEWEQQFIDTRRQLESILSNKVVAIQHIGSTSIPGLPAKDVIDVQISVHEFNPAILDALSAAGMRTRTDYRDYHYGLPEKSAELQKWYAREPIGHRRTNIHIRQIGRFNHRFALLFRDFLRSDEQARAQYLIAKQEAAKAYPMISMDI